GYLNSAQGDYSLAAGHFAKTQFPGSFVWGDNSTASYVTDGASNQFIARAAGGTKFYPNSALTAGVVLAAGGGSWSSVSDRNLKENFDSVDGSSLLENLDRIPIESWSYKSQDHSIRHLGPMAQDFYASFGLGEDDKHISTVDADGVALAAVQALYR